MKKFWNKTTQHAINTLATLVVAWAVMSATNIIEWFQLPVENKERHDRKEIVDSIQNVALDQRVTENQFEAVVDELNKKADNAVMEAGFNAVNGKIQLIVDWTKKQSEISEYITEKRDSI